LLDGSKHSKASRHTSSYANAGLHSPKDSSSIHTIKCWD
jgi:hypothetical protein